MTDLDGPGWSDAVWVNEPTRWRRQGADLSLTADGGTDFWRHTHYGFVRDSGHAALTRVPGEFVATVEVQADYRDQYDQAGLMVRLDETVWLKCGIELLDGVHQVSAVVTRDHSDWSVVPLPAPPGTLRLRVDRAGGTLEVRYALDGGPETLLRQAHLTGAETLRVGPMLASPKGGGITARFRGFAVRDG